MEDLCDLRSKQKFLRQETKSTNNRIFKNDKLVFIKFFERKENENETETSHKLRKNILNIFIWQRTLFQNI